jgi:hypothetical protein
MFSRKKENIKNRITERREAMILGRLGVIVKRSAAAAPSPEY